MNALTKTFRKQTRTVILKDFLTDRPPHAELIYLMDGNLKKAELWLMDCDYKKLCSDIQESYYRWKYCARTETYLQGYTKCQCSGKKDWQHYQDYYPVHPISWVNKGEYDSFERFGNPRKVNILHPDLYEHYKKYLPHCVKEYIGSDGYRFRITTGGGHATIVVESEPFETLKQMQRAKQRWIKNERT